MSGIDRAEVAPNCVLEWLTPRLTGRPVASGISKGFVLLSVASTVAIFLGSISLATVGEASGLSVLADRPLATFQTAVGLSLWTTLLALPAAKGFARLCVRREVRIEGDTVEILRHTLLGIARRSIPLSAYQGVALNTRTSLSGLTQEIVLVHPRTDLNVTLLSGEGVTERAFDACKALFKLPELPAGAIYERGTRRGSREVSTAFYTVRS